LLINDLSNADKAFFFGLFPRVQKMRSFEIRERTAQPR